MVQSSDYDLAQESPAVASARQLLSSKIQIGKGEALKLAKHCAAILPRDHYVWPDLLHFYVHGRGPWELRVKYKSTDGKEHDVRLHNHAVNQMCHSSITGIPKAYANKAVGELWRIDLLATMFNTHFCQQEFLNKLKQPAQFLTRLVQLDPPEMRGFLTQSYNRHLASPPLLVAFLEECRKMGAHPVKAWCGDITVKLCSFLPYVFEPVKGELLAVGAMWQNGDFGGTSVKVTLATMRVLHNSVVPATEAFSRIHLGSVIKNTDMELDDEAAAAEVNAVAKALQSGVRNILKPESVQRLMDVIAEAAGDVIQWDRLSNMLRQVASKEQRRRLAEMLENRAAELPPPGIGADGNPIPTRWWASNALSWLSESEPDITKSDRLQRAAGNILTPNATDEEENAA
jgi:hypothetical protein